MRSVALANQKGGVGKTTTAIHLAHGLALGGARVALFDLDPQANATVAVQAMEAGDPERAGDTPWGHLRCLDSNFWILPSPGADKIARGAKVDVDALGRLVDQLDAEGLDWLLVDCPPRMDDWGWAGLQLCQEVLVPVQAEFFAMHGLSQMMRTLEEAARGFPGKGRLMGVLATLVDPREPVTREVLQDLQGHLGDRLLQSVIFRDSQLVEAASHGKTLYFYNPFAKGALSYGELVREVTHGRSKVG